MGKILILGGTRFFGKRLVELLQQEGSHEITVATRGHNIPDIGPSIKHVIIDRTRPEDIKRVAQLEKWDCVYDNICYSSNEALASVKAFQSQPIRYILTSTLSVYDPEQELLREDRFDPYSYPIQMGDKDQFSYQEGKRQAEAVFAQRADFAFTATRIPIVLGPDDYTRRLHWHVERVQRGLPIGIPNLDAHMSFIHAEEVASFLRWLGNPQSIQVVGPVNASAQGQMSIREILSQVERIAHIQAKITNEFKNEDASPFGIPDNWVMDTTKASQAGFKFSHLADWLPILTQNIWYEMEQRMEWVKE
ncbi:nucleoside-diphosphate-sugar epimerase [Paenibacillus shirakamiensis]|uniref:Nucleoside-diphosphate-sugar epimerase n=1 Tax=Paenibacillus shirakamiensis TaxID=1265935 RepID=A0ABS4JGT9_9BACL|nr:NAD-dependent epimerase/dehydratase family protein [Paenibacillus shirakamiensis]MBP2000933.1 nucleoside-diphosphate-sugar epimerase [Paenibacillus shirakamiensis]